MRSGHVAQTHVKIGGLSIYFTTCVWQRAQREQVGSESDFILTKFVGQRLNAVAIPRENQLTPFCVEPRERKHAAQSLQASCSPVAQGIKQHFRIAGRAKLI